MLRPPSCPNGARRNPIHTLSYSRREIHARPGYPELYEGSLAYSHVSDTPLTPTPARLSLSQYAAPRGTPGVFPHAGALLAEAGRSGQKADSLYIHVPFCFHKCHYCDFYSIVDTRDRQAAFTARLIDELHAMTPWLQTPVRTVFVGGGTPSLLLPDLWVQLLRSLDAAAGVATIADRGGEFTVECNPETVTPELMAIFKAGGVTRVSVGAQSFNPVHLKTLERWHDPANVFRAIELARSAGISRQSMDLIFGIPGQTLDDWRNDLRLALSAGTEHLSCYGLTYEPGTAMTARHVRGDFARIDEDLEADMFLATVSDLHAAGLDRYEVSNFARPGAECRHNLAYWRQHNWLAAGPSASGHLAGWRWKNTPRLDDYLSRGEGGFSPVVDIDSPEPRRALVELVLTASRLREGLDEQTLLARADGIDVSIRPRWAEAVHELRTSGLLADDPAVIRMSDAGYLVANRVILDLVTAVDPD